MSNNSLNSSELLRIVKMLSLRSSIHSSIVVHDVFSSDHWIENIKANDPFIANSIHIIPILNVDSCWRLLLLEPLTKSTQPTIIYCEPINGTAIPSELKLALDRIVPNGSIFRSITQPVVTDSNSALSGIAIIEICRRLFHWVEVVLAGFSLQEKKYDDPLSTVESNNSDLLLRRLVIYRNYLNGELSTKSNESSQTVVEEHAIIRTRSDYTQIDLSQLLNDDDDSDSLTAIEFQGTYKRQKQQ